MLREFHCVQDCSDCCMYRQYYPSVDYGKIGVLLLPEEKKRVQKSSQTLPNQRDHISKTGNRG